MYGGLGTWNHFTVRGTSQYSLNRVDATQPHDFSRFLLALV